MTAQSESAARPGSPRSLLGRLVALILVRAELFAIEAQEHKEALVGQLLLSLLAFCALLFSLMAGLLFIVVVTPAGARPTVLAGLALAGLVAALGIGWRLAIRLRRAPPAFSETLTEVGKDCQTLFNLRN